MKIKLEVLQCFQAEGMNIIKETVIAHLSLINQEDKVN